MRFDSASKALIELAASRHNAFTTSEAAELNVPLRRLQHGESRGELTRLYPKVWSFAFLPSSPHQRIRAACLALPGSAATMMAAAWLHGWVDHAPDKPQIWVGSKSRARLGGASVSRFRRIEAGRDVEWLGHIPVINKAATLCLVGGSISSNVLEHWLDDFRRTESEGWLRETLGRLYTPKTAGPHSLKKLLEDPRRCEVVPESVMERVTARILSGDGLPPIALQHQVEIEGRNFRLDLACPTLKLGIEYHSRQHHWGPVRADADNQRDVLLAVAGWEVIYVTHSMVRDPDSLVRRFRQAARTRSQQLGVAMPAQSL